MAEDQKFMEERYFGGRCFRRLCDNRVVEVLSDGSILEDFSINGREYSSYDIEFEQVEKATEQQFESGPEQSESVRDGMGESAEGSKMDRFNAKDSEMFLDSAFVDQDVSCAKYANIDMDPGGGEDQPPQMPQTPKVKDSRFKLFETNYSGYKKKGIKELLKEAEKMSSLGSAHTLASAHGLRGGRGLKGPTGLLSKNKNPLNNLLNDSIGSKHNQAGHGRMKTHYMKILKAQAKSGNTFAKRRLARTKDGK